MSATAPTPRDRPTAEPGPAAPHPRLRERTLVLVGLMGAGKSSIGRGLAAALDLPFRDADQEIEIAADRSVSEIFAEHGEAVFRDGERRVIARLLTQEPPHVLALGGGAFTDARTRALVRERALAVWLKVGLDVLARRVARKSTRPLLVGRDPMEVLSQLAEQRHPHYAEAQVTVETGDVNLSQSVETVLGALNAHLQAERPS